MLEPKQETHEITALASPPPLPPDPLHHIPQETIKLRFDEAEVGTIVAVPYYQILYLGEVKERTESTVTFRFANGTEYTYPIPITPSRCIRTTTDAEKELWNSRLSKNPGE